MLDEYKNIDTYCIDEKSKKLANRLLAEIDTPEVIELYTTKIPLHCARERFISELLNYVTEEKILNETYKDLIKKGWLANSLFDYRTEDYEKYNQFEKLRIKAFVVASLLEYECLTKKGSTNNKPKFEFKFSDSRTLKFNRNDWNDYCVKMLIFNEGKRIEQLPTSEKLQIIKERRKFFAEGRLFEKKHAEKGFEYFSYLDEKIETKVNHSTEHQNQDKEHINQHPEIFNDGAFEKFEKWINLSDDEPYKKFSFIFQRLKMDNELRKDSFKETLNWLYENEYINPETYSSFIIKNNWISPSNILGKETSNRNTLYYSINSK